METFNPNQRVKIEMKPARKIGYLALKEKEASMSHCVLVE
tara:strand:+ start:5328 stop:5447 length:120 start_codon:yes stop_codon:yes gene_type:complete